MIIWRHVHVDRSTTGSAVDGDNLMHEWTKTTWLATNANGSQGIYANQLRLLRERTNRSRLQAGGDGVGAGAGVGDACRVTKQTKSRSMSTLTRFGSHVCCKSKVITLQVPLIRPMQCNAHPTRPWERDSDWDWERCHNFVWALRCHGCVTLFKKKKKKKLKRKAKQTKRNGKTTMKIGLFSSFDRRFLKATNRSPPQSSVGNTDSTFHNNRSRDQRQTSQCNSYGVGIAQFV